MKAVILAGGLGTRLSEETSLKPKPMNWERLREEPAIRRDLQQQVMAMTQRWDERLKADRALKK